MCINRHNDEETGRAFHHCQIYVDEPEHGRVEYRINSSEIFLSLNDLVDKYKRKTLPIKVITETGVE